MDSENTFLLNKPSGLDEGRFIAQFKDIYEHSVWVANAAWQAIQTNEQPEKYDDRVLFQSLLHEIVERSGDEAKLALLRAHPDLAGKAALSGELTLASTSEQAGAGLSQCTQQELERFTRYNSAYQQKFGFPFIMAVKGATKKMILSGFETRINNSIEQEFAMAMTQVHKIAAFRLAEK
ncbi:MAG: 2-oxo-4-hydroxy-4-carboxy-5-ureidoimidazoline decarboxylase [Marinomonas sp.]